MEGDVTAAQCVIAGIVYRNARNDALEDASIAAVESLANQGEEDYARVQTGLIQLRHIQPVHFCVVAEDPSVIENNRPKIIGARRSYVSLVHFKGKKRLSSYGEYIFVHPDYLRRGIAINLSVCTSRFFAMDNYDISWGLVDVDNEAAIGNLNRWVDIAKTKLKSTGFRPLHLIWGGWLLDDTFQPKYSPSIKIEKVSVDQAVQLIERHFHDFLPVDHYLVPLHPLCIGVYKASSTASAAAAADQYAIVTAWDSGRYGNWHSNVAQPTRTVTLANFACSDSSTQGLQLLQELIVQLSMQLRDAGHDCVAYMLHEQHPIKAFVESLALGTGTDMMQILVRNEQLTAADKESRAFETVGLDYYYDPRCMAW
eukprot:TRINITY_DN13545_c0_g1_i1.p1 TRINITY_DN13545_c0_g1~~TRINITY_DN13545_c0_g1_i1.p1  ORF type:complete len:369 (-),score=47.44 TRINITY_DN13545_c0_g1_i1:99-1205(-)